VSTVTTADTPHGDGGERPKVRLYVAGTSPNSRQARANLEAALGQFPDHRIEVEIIDVLGDPERSLRDGVLVTPMLVKVAPAPERRILGRLSDRTTLLEALDLGGPES
jgi:circadian clock protein KaiB